MHSIRLREPWQQIDLPEVPLELQQASQDIAAEAGTVLHFARAFNLPTGLEPEQRVLLALRPSITAVAALPGLAVCLNNTLIEPWTPTAASEETGPIQKLYPTESHLAAFNRLVVAIAIAAAKESDSQPNPQFTELAEANLLILESTGDCLTHDGLA